MIVNMTDVMLYRIDAQQIETKKAQHYGIPDREDAANEIQRSRLEAAVRLELPGHYEFRICGCILQMKKPFYDLVFWTETARDLTPEEKRNAVNALST